MADFDSTPHEIPRELPVMTLPGTVLFPQAILPLYIFEPRYRKMLEDVLAGDRMFAIVALDEQAASETDQFEPPHKMGTVGIVRSVCKNADGTSNLVLQGLARVEVVRVAREEPYRVIEVNPVASQGHPNEFESEELRQTATDLLKERRDYGGGVSEPFLNFIRTVEEPEAFIDLMAYAMCVEVEIKQRLLEDLDTRRRFQRFLEYMRRNNASLRLERQLQGRLGDDDIALN